LEIGTVAVPASAEVEQETVERARRGDQRALADIYDWYLPRIYRYVLARVGNVIEAEDLTEDIFLRMLGAIGGYRMRNIPFSAWLFRIAHNHVVSYFRKSGARGTTGILDEGIADSRADPATLVETRLTVEEVVRATRGLPEAQKEVIALRFAVGLSVAETAQVLGKREGNVKALQHKAVARLQRELAAKPERWAAEGLR
jgi:RNA polymerase sigma-70 factor (ECF subfamily)